MAIQAFMSEKGGRTATTWATGSSWRTDGGKKMKTIRVPDALADEVMRCARAIDAGIAVSHGNMANEQEIILGAIAAYIELRRGNRHPNQHRKELHTQARTWDELNKFEVIVKTQPEKLRLKNE